MSCTQTLSGLAKDCAANMGGIVEALIALYDDVTAVTITSDVISAITMASGKKFKVYHFAKNTGNLTSTYTIDPATGVKFVSSDLLLQFNRMQTTARVEITALALADLVVIVKDANGKYWYLGKDEPVNASAGDGQTGTARGDANRYTITLHDESKEMPYEVSDSIIEGLL
ncbi:MAG: hypothetical protein IKY16_02925 [Bacteroidales bacterium]|nr:hypothetical protein [Bacteroidales bacterium]MBR5013542.1 hypothetical protein [Bacteroidales bacterium]